MYKAILRVGPYSASACFCWYCASCMMLTCILRRSVYSFEERANNHPLSAPLRALLPLTRYRAGITLFASHALTRSSTPLSIVIAHQLHPYTHAKSIPTPYKTTPTIQQTRHHAIPFRTTRSHADSHHSKYIAMRGRDGSSGSMFGLGRVGVGSRVLSEGRIKAA